jgi:hypothetical protein
VFTQDVSPEGVLDVTPERQAELARLLESLATKVEEPATATV